MITDVRPVRLEGSSQLAALDPSVLLNIRVPDGIHGAHIIRHASHHAVEVCGLYPQQMDQVRHLLIC